MADDDPLKNLQSIGKLKAEPFADGEYRGLIRSAKRRLADARNAALAPESRFDLAYNAAHGLALAALRRRGYRSENRYIVFQVLEQTTGLPAAIWRVLSKCHDLRNLAEYEGHAEIDPALLSDLIRCATELEARVEALPVPMDDPR
jgi:hypothetical protein